MRKIGKKFLSQEMLASLVNEIIGEYDIKLTVRQIYYRLVVGNVMPNTRSYYNSFDSILTTLRKKGLVDPAAIEDRSRQTIGGDVQKIRTPEEFFKATLNYLKESWKDYDLPLWTSQESYIEVWLEKDALSALVSEVCNRYRVLLFPNRGYSSYTMIREAMPRLFLREQNQMILYFGDHDPSGLQAIDRIKKDLKEEDLPSENVIPIALTMDQVKEHGLPSQPVKLSDTRAKWYIEKYGTRECWELDALPPDTLQAIVDKAIRDQINQQVWDKELEEIDEGQGEVKRMIDKLMNSLDEEELNNK